MPLVKKNLTIAAGATSEQVLQGTTYEYVDPGTRIVLRLLNPPELIAVIL